MYRVVPDAPSLEQVAALPVEALSAYAVVLAVLESQPWNGRPQHEDNPGGAPAAGAVAGLTPPAHLRNDGLLANAYDMGA